MSASATWRDDYPGHKDAPIGECSECGQTGVPVLKTVDPYDAEVHPDRENPERDFCYRCWRHLADEI